MVERRGSMFEVVYGCWMISDFAGACYLGSNTRLEEWLRRSVETES